MFIIDRFMVTIAYSEKLYDNDTTMNTLLWLHMSVNLIILTLNDQHIIF